MEELPSLRRDGNLERTQKICDELLAQEIPTTEKFFFVKKEGGSIQAMELDMGDYASIQAFAKNIKATHPKIDVLINNAGVIPSNEYTESKHGLEITYQTLILLPSWY